LRTPNSLALTLRESAWPVQNWAYQILPRQSSSAQTLQESELGMCNLAGADLRGADLRGAKTTLACFAGADLRGANLEGCWFAGSDLQGADLRWANLRRTSFASVGKLSAALVKDVKWEDADLAGAVLPDGSCVRE
jgi:uncharacterized protein YjbI with pentapeptide repeats